MGLSADAYARQLAQLLPRGALWKLEPDSWLSKLLLAIAGELARIDDRSDDLVDEWDPRTALETLPEWERVVGITDPSAVTSERQAAIAAKLVARGGQTAAYFVEFAALLGFVATVDTHATDPALGPYEWRMNVDLAASTAGGLATTIARAGTARAGDRVESRSVAVLEDLINRWKPAHTVALFAYST